MSEYRAPEETLGTVVPKPKRHRGQVGRLLTREISNLPIRVPSTDWPAVITGQKRMFRSYGLSPAYPEKPLVPPDTACPRPCLLFAARHDGPHRSRTWKATRGVLLSHRQEPLGAITSEDLVAEGFEFLPAFRFYWRQRYKRLGWRPWDMVSVLEVRPWEPGVRASDDQVFGAWALQELYGEWLR